MFSIDRNDVEKLSKGKDSKEKNYKSNDKIERAYKSTIWNIIDCVCGFSLYEMCHWINFIDRWILNRSENNTRTYKRGDIIYVDLGASNFRFEPSFTHPCIVLENRKTKLLVVPCSSKKFGQNYRDVVDAYIRDGFKINTGIQVEEFRWINKNRIISSQGKVSSRVLNEIDDHILSIVPKYKITKKKINDMEKRISELELQLDKQRENITLWEETKK